jgi:hypothetical protein
MLYEFITCAEILCGDPFGALGLDNATQNQILLRIALARIASAALPVEFIPEMAEDITDAVHVNSLGVY